MHRLVPPFVLENWLGGKGQGTFQAASLFVDVSGFTAITDRLMQHGQHGAEVLAEVMRTIFDPLVHTVYAQGGFVAFFAGDAFTALFAHEPDRHAALRRALAAAWSIREHMVAARRTTPYGDFGFAVKVGLATGQTEWGIFRGGRQPRHAFYFKGGAIDGCAQAEHRAHSGEVIVSRAVYELLRSEVRGEPCEAESQVDHFRVVEVVSQLPIPQEISLPPVLPRHEAAFFPERIVRQSLSGEFRQALNLFVGLRDVHTHQQLAGVMEVVFDLQDRYGGLLNRIDFGDKGCTLLLFWGAPLGFENDVERALSFVLDLQAAVPVPSRAGLTYRISHAGFVGSTLHKEYTCYGRGVNLAARLVMAAPWGEVWLDEPVARRAGRRFGVGTVGSLVFKGFGEPQSVFMLRGQRAMAVAPFYRGDMVGRQQEMARLQAFVEPLWAGRFAGALIVYGEPGIGKSRLLYEFGQQLAFRELEAVEIPVWFSCQTDEILRQSLNPFRYWLRDYFDQREGGPPAERERRFEDRLSALIARTPDPALQAELERTRSFLGALVDLHWPDSLYEQLEHQLRFDNTLDAIKTLIEAESLCRPVVLLVEDVQWLDDDSRQCLRHLTRNVDDYPFVVLGSSRYPDQRPPLDTVVADLFSPAIRQGVLDLQALSGIDVGSLAQSILAGPVASSLWVWLAERADGNPFFVEQLLLYLREQGLLAEGDDGYVMLSDADVLVPTDVRAALVARLDRLAQEVKQVVQAAAVLGREFEVLVLSQMLRGDESVPARVERAEEEAIWSALSQIRYIFRHTLLRDSAYDMQLQARRRDLHALAAEALEQVYAADLSPHYADLAYHCDRAELYPQAAGWYRLAGERAAKQYANAEAVACLSRAIELTPQADIVERYTLLRAREKVYELQVAVEAWIQDLTAMQTLAEALGDDHKRAEVASRRICYQRNTSRYTEATVSTAHEAIELARLAQDPSIEAAVCMEWGRCLLGQNIDVALEQFERALALARTAGLHQLEASLLSSFGIAYINKPDYAEAKRCLEQSLTICLELGDRRAEVNALTNLAALAVCQGDYVEAQRRCEQAWRVGREIGYRPSEFAALGNLGELCIKWGDYARAKIYLTQALQKVREMGLPPSESFVLARLGWLCCLMGDDQAAVEHANQALAIGEEIRGVSLQVGALKTQGHALMSQGNLAQAAETYTRALDLARGYGERDLILETLAGLAHTSWLQGNLDEALGYAEEILSYLEGWALGNMDNPFWVAWHCYQVLQAKGDSRAQELLTAAYALLQRQAARLTDPETRRSFLENVAVHREIVRAWERHRRISGLVLPPENRLV